MRAAPPAATATPAQLPAGGVLVVGASASGRADRRRARPAPAATSSWRSAATPGCRAATAAWTSSGGWSPPAGWPAPSTSARPGGGPPRAVAAARRPRPDPTGDLDLADAAGARRPARRAARRRRRARTSSFGDDLAATTARRRPRLRRLLDDIDGYVDARRPGPRGRSPDRPAASPVAPTSRRGWTCAPSGIAHRRAGHRLPAAPTPGCACRSSARDGAIRQHRGVTAASRPLRRRPALPAPARLELHRRRPARRARRRRPPVLGRQPPGSRPLIRRRRPHERRYDVVVVGGRVAGAADRAAARPRRRCGSRVRRPRPRTAATPSPPTR